jgi:predicted nucleotidyltransferase
MREPPIQQIVEKIVEAFHPRRIVLFGGRARGEQDAESDVDLLVEMETGLQPLQRRLAVDRLFGLRDWPMDVFVYTPEEVEQRRDMVGTLTYAALREGETVYEET